MRRPYAVGMYARVSRYLPRGVRYQLWSRCNRPKRSFCEFAIAVRFVWTYKMAWRKIWIPRRADLIVLFYKRPRFEFINNRNLNGGQRFGVHPKPDVCLRLILDFSYFHLHNNNNIVIIMSAYPQCFITKCKTCPDVRTLTRFHENAQRTFTRWFKRK